MSDKTLRDELIEALESEFTFYDGFRMQSDNTADCVIKGILSRARRAGSREIAERAEKLIFPGNRYLENGAADIIESSISEAMAARDAGESR